MQDEQAVRRHAADLEQEYASYANAASYGDRMAVASRQARQVHHQPRFIDEVV